MNKHRAGFKLVTVALTIAVVGGLAWYGIARSGLLSGEETEELTGAPVQRGLLRVSVVERGNLKAADAVVLKSEIEGNATILFLIPEGTQVKEGDLVCELDATQQIDRRVAQEITLRNADAAFIKAKQNYEIQKSQNDSDIKRAEQALSFADVDLIKFREGDKAAKEAQASEKIKLAEEENTRASDKFNWSQTLFDSGFLTSTELEGDRLSRSRAEIQLEQARRDRDLLVRFQLPRDEAELVAKLDEARRELDRVKLQAAARLVDFEADMRTREAQYNLEREKLQKLETQISKAKMRAPRAGMVVYAQQDSGGRMGGSQPIQEGTSVRERQDIVTIPSATGMVAQVSLHESVLKQVSVGQNCLLKIDALGVREFQGRVSFVAVLPDQNSWWANPNTRLYRTEVQILDGIPDMRPGMSCQIEILVDDIPNATYAPVQAVFRSGGDNIAFVTRPGGKYEERKVQVGRYTNNWVEIVSGLEVGELVMLTAPVGFSPAPAPQAVPTAPTATTPGAGAANAAAPAANANAAGPGGAPAAAGDGAARPAGGERGGRAGGGERGARGERGAAPATGADGAAMSEEERERMRAQWRERMANMSEEERAKLMEQMRQRGQGGAGEAGGAGAGGAPGGGQK
jgi:HlyD family secretion protein